MERNHQICIRMVDVVLIMFWLTQILDFKEFVVFATSQVRNFIIFKIEERENIQIKTKSVFNYAKIPSEVSPQ